MEEPSPPFSLSPEQQETVALLERLLGKTIANRFVDFTRLAESATGLKVSRPMAAHALRELESMIRASLEVPMDAKAAAKEEDEKQLAAALKALKGMGYSEGALQRAEKALEPRLNHATQIKLIAERLGLSPDGDIANAWVSLTSTFGRAHERDYQRALIIDDEFREKFQRPFELVLRGLLTALQKKYAALMQRVDAIGCSISLLT